MNQKIIIRLLLILLFGFCIIWVLKSFWKKQQLKKEHAIAIAQIYSCTAGGRGNGGGLFIDFKISVNGNDYYASSRYLTSILSAADCESHFLGKTFPAVYNLKNPSLANLLIFPEDFALYNYPFPDSLKWVLQYKRGMH